MRTILRTRDANGNIHLFSFQTSPILNQEEQIEKVIKREKMNKLEILDWQYFDAIELKNANQ